MSTTREVCGAMIGRGGETSLMRELYEDVSSRPWIRLALDDLLGHSQKLAKRAIDPRIAHALESLSFGPDELLPIDWVAGRVGLSASRFQYLFTHEVGVPFRRYRAWRRLRIAISEIVNGNNFTTAAHSAGFADQAHFAHDFRKTFGAPASRGLAKVRA
jgi:AraC-like DNA-binding protein